MISGIFTEHAQHRAQVSKEKAPARADAFLIITRLPIAQ
jgi:hypothetical protein